MDQADKVEIRNIGALEITEAPVDKNDLNKGHWVRTSMGDVVPSSEVPPDAYVTPDDYVVKTTFVDGNGVTRVVKK